MPKWRSEIFREKYLPRLKPLDGSRALVERVRADGLKPHVVLHGSGEPSIAQFEPRQPIDISAFGGQNAVYAAADGIWAMFFAIVDRERVPSVSNACMKIVDATRTVSGPLRVLDQPVCAAKSTVANGHGLPPATEHLHRSSANHNGSQ